MIKTYIAVIGLYKIGTVCILYAVRNEAKETVEVVNDTSERDGL
jgi:hypothetical protein